MSTLDLHRGVLKARERFLEDGRLEESSDVRPDILESWRRSMLCAVNPRLDAPGLFADTTDSAAVEIATPIIDRAFRTVESDVATLVLTNAAGIIQRRWTRGSWLTRSVAEPFSELGASLSEASVGANAIGIVQETGRPAIVSGAEHYSESFLPVTCAGAPIMHPITSKIIGILDVTCRVSETSAMLLPWVTAIATDVERALLERSSRAERMLLDEYVRASRMPGKTPVICLNDRTIIAAPSAARVIDGVGQALLWERVREVVSANREEEFALSVDDRDPVTVWCRPIIDGDATVGAVVRLSEGTEAETAMRSSSVSRAVAGRIGFLNGQSVAWRSMCEDVELAKTMNVPMVLRGGSGAGKFALAESIYPDFENIVLDAEDAGEDPSRWLANLQRTITTDPVRVVIIRHLDVLQQRHRRSVANLIERSSVDASKRVIVTETVGVGMLDDADDLNGFVVNVPSLDERREDLPHLLESLSESLTGRARRWRPEAVQVIARADWPGNLRQLRNVVRTVLVTHPVGDIGLKQLPIGLLTSAPKRYLSRLERLELNEISAALKYFNGNKVEAAEYLEISRSTLYRKIRAFGLDLDRLAY